MNNSATKKDFFNNRSLIGKRKVWGFTLLEMLVVLAITAIIAILILANLRQGQKNYVLSQAAQTLVGNLREAQNMAVTGAEVAGQSQIGGFGIYINNSTNPYYSYSLFLNTASRVADGCQTGTVPSPPLKTVNLPSGISINNLGTNVFFAPPQPLTCINSTSQNSITYTLRETSTGKTTRVIINKYGIIDIQ